MSVACPPFTRLARVYDAIMADVDYEGWMTFVLDTLERRGWGLGAERLPVLDLACGTGNSIRPLLECGFDVVGVDASASMLEVAGEKFPHLRFYKMGFLELELAERFQLVTCIFDSLNNLTDPHELAHVFERVRAQLLPGGEFVFDVNTRFGVRDLWDEGRLEGQVLVEDEVVEYRWTHCFDEIKELGRVTARCFAPWGSFVEEHVERGYDPEELYLFLTQAGFVDIEILEYPDAQVAGPDAPRVWAFARNPRLQDA